MRPRLRPIAGLALGLASLWLLSPTDAAQGGRGPDTPLSSKMGEIDGLVKQLEELVGEEPEWAEALESTCRLQQLVLEAKSLDPASLAGLEGEDKQQKARIEFRTTMQELVDALFLVELAVLEESSKKAEKAVRGLEKVKSTGHGKFK